MTTFPARDRLDQAARSARAALLAELSPDGHWVGELSTSALATATAVMALEMLRKHGSIEHAAGVPLPPLIAEGIGWLAAHQNADGGWGDTTLGVSNISTTFLARAVFLATGNEDRYRTVVDAACAYIVRAGGVPAVVARYGRDRTFSVPILTHGALAGLVDWSTIPALPFELACLPARFYKTVRLPVVSYALPALIAIGQVRHHHHKPSNPVSRAVRRYAASPSLNVLERIQPPGGGFLEATPLTSFVTMSLAAMGLARHPVAQRGAEFIVRSARPDGSWPIDTNLSTWVTTLAVNAWGGELPGELRPRLLRWLLDQQYKTVHPYTNADPGGWAWTDLPGGVPDADDTPGALLAIMNLAGPALRDNAGSPSADAPDGSVSEADRAVLRGINWLLDLQNRDGGWPTFCRGWGALPFDRSAPDITAHVVRSLFAAFQRFFPRDPQAFPSLAGIVFSGAWSGDWITAAAMPRILRSRAPRAIRRGLRFLERVQRGDGAWLPLWFGNQHAPDDENPTYGTSRVLAAYRAANCLDTPPAARGLQWLRLAVNTDGGWGAGPGTPSTTEETALAVEMLLADPHGRKEAGRGLTWLLERVEDDRWTQPSPIGFYFAKLWYFERLYPLIFTVGALHSAGRVVNPPNAHARSVLRT